MTELEQLIALIEAAHADSAQIPALIDFIEEVMGDSIDILTQPTWDQVVSDGETRTHNLTVLGLPVEIIISGDLVVSRTCDALTERVLPLLEHDVTLTPLITGTPPSGTGDYDEIITVPSYEVHFDDPNIVYLNIDDPVDEAIADNIRYEGSSFNNRTVGGIDYRSALRMKWEWTAEVELYHHHQSGSGDPLVGHTYGYRLRPPPIGTMQNFRNPSGGSGLTIDDPIRLGTISGIPPHVQTDYDFCRMVSRTSLEADEEQELTKASVRSSTHSIESIASGDTHSTINSAWDAFMASYDTWMASSNAYDPEIIIDEDARTVTVRYVDYENTMTQNMPLCSTAFTESTVPYYLFTINYAGWIYEYPQNAVSYRYAYSSTNGSNYFDGLQIRIINDLPGDAGYTYTEYRSRPLALDVGEFIPSVEAIGEAPDGAPPTVLPNPPLITPKPVSGGCKATMDGPSSCNFNVPVDPDPDSPLFPDPGDLVQPDIPDFDMPEMPVVDVDVPTFPPIDCLMPDFGNLSDCEPGPGSGAGLSGGRDRHGKRGAGIGGIKTGGPTYGIRDPTFNQDFPDGTIDPDTGEPIIPPTRSFPEGSSVMTAITIILLDLKISPLNIIFEVGPEWDKTFGPKTFPETTRMFDAAQWLASLIMCRIIDEGDGKVYIGPITHRPGQNTWTFNSQFPNADGDPPMLGLGYGASMGEAYYAIEVWGAHLGESVFALVDTPFSTDPQNILSIEVGPDYSLAEAQELAAFRAGLIRREAVMVQVEVPYSQEIFMRDKMILKFPDRGLQSEYIIFAKQSEISVEKIVNILTGVLPATLEELENFPDVMDEGMDAVEMGFA